MPISTVNSIRREHDNARERLCCDRLGGFHAPPDAYTQSHRNHALVEGLGFGQYAEQASEVARQVQPILTAQQRYEEATKDPKNCKELSVLADYLDRPNRSYAIANRDPIARNLARQAWVGHEIAQSKATCEASLHQNTMSACEVVEEALRSSQYGQNTLVQAGAVRRMAGTSDPFLPASQCRDSRDGFDARPNLRLEAEPWTKMRHNFGGHARWADVDCSQASGSQQEAARNTLSIMHGWRAQRQSGIHATSGTVRALS